MNPKSYLDIRLGFLILLALAMIMVGQSACDDDGGNSRITFTPDDDDGSSDDDDDDDDDNDDNDDDTSPEPAEKILIIWGTSESQASALSSLLTNLGYTVSKLREQDIEEDNVIGYDLIVISGDTSWQNMARAELVEETGANIFAIYEGGAYFLDYFNLRMGYGGGIYRDFEQSVRVVDQNDSIWKKPNAISVVSEESIQLYSSKVFARTKNVQTPGQMKVYGSIQDQKTYPALSLENGRFFYWAFELGANMLNSTGTNVLENAVYLAGTQ